MISRFLMLNFCNKILNTFFYWTAINSYFWFPKQVPHNFKNQEHTNFDLVSQRFILCGLFYKTVIPNKIILMSYQLLPHHCSLFQNQIYHTCSFTILNKSLKKKEKYTKGFKDYSYIFRCTCLSNQSTFGSAKQLVRSFAHANEWEISRFWPLPFRELVWNLIIQVNNGMLAAYITVFDPRRDKRRCFIPFLVYARVYPSISSNRVTLDTIISRPESVYMYNSSTLLRKPLLWWLRTADTRLLTNWQIA